MAAAEARSWAAESGIQTVAALLQAISAAWGACLLLADAHLARNLSAWFPQAQPQPPSACDSLPDLLPLREASHTSTNKGALTSPLSICPPCLAAVT